MNRFQKKLQQLEAHNRLRSLSLPNGIDLSSNDYLGMRSHPQLRSAAIEALENGIDLGAGGSRLLRGHTEHHENLEHFAASYLGAEKTLFFPTGYQANMALFQALPARQDTVIFDEFIHASAREAIQNSPAAQIKVRHNDPQAFEDALRRAREYRKPDSQVWMAVESLYSMDGDFAPVAELYRLAQQYDAILIVDEAHATGVWGKDGKGLAAELPQQNLITLHTCGKAIGVAGGLICARGEIIDMLVNTARPFIYSTAPPPLQALLVQKSLELLQQEPQRRETLFKLIEAAKRLLPAATGSQIIPIILGSDEAALAAAQYLQQAGFDIRAIRPPTVPENTARLRLSLSTAIEEKTLQQFSSEMKTLSMQRSAA